MRKMLFACVASVAMAGLIACDDVNDPIGDPVNLSFAPCLGSPDNPTWFAVQDGDGGWQRVTATSGSFDFTISSGRGGIATYNVNDGIFVLYATTEELEANMPTCNGASVRSVAGTVTGYVTADKINIAMGTSSTGISGTATPPAPFTLTGVDATSTDLVAVRYRTVSSPTAFEIFPNNIVLRRGVNGSTTPVVDFASASEAGAPLSRTLSVTNIVAGEELYVYSNVALPTTMANIAAYEAAPSLVPGVVTAPFYGVAGSRLAAGESQMIIVGAGRTESSSSSSSRFMTSVFTDPADRSMTFGPVLSAVSVTPGSRPAATYTVQSGYDNLFDVLFSQGGGASFRQVEVLATKAYLGGSVGTVTLSVPDLSGASGFSSSWLLTTGVSSTWTFLATNADLSVLNGKAVTYQGADRRTVFTP